MGRRTGLTLAERSGQPSPSAPDGDADRQTRDRVRPVVTRHCWVRGLPDRPGRWPGLLAEWRQDGGSGRWLGRVVYVVDDAGQAVLIETWVDAEHLTPN